MAKAKNKVVVESADDELPEGFTKLESMSPPWKPESEGDTLIGTIKRIRVVPMRATATRPARNVKVYKIVVQSGSDEDVVDVWESAGLAALEDAGEGQTVFIRFRGMKTIPGQPQPMRDYLVAVRDN